MSDGAVQKSICPICFDDLKPATDILQTIPNCGHVFHEQCLQQWLEYCPAGKKPACPVCKQPCSQRNITRLYFQSSGDTAPTQDPFTDLDVEELSEKLKRAEYKLSSVGPLVENLKAQVKELVDECSSWKEMSKRELASKEEIKRMKESLEISLQVKTEDLQRKSAECVKLEERSMGLAKELAVLKLAADSNLDEEEIAKLASLGHDKNKSTAVDVLRRSLALRNKSYQELMARCSLLGRSETRALKEVEKAEEKIRTLKGRLQELKKAFKEKGNGIQRDSNGSSKRKLPQQDLNFDKLEPESLHSIQVQAGGTTFPKSACNKTIMSINLPNHAKPSAEGRHLVENSTLLVDETNNTIDLDTDCCILSNAVAENSSKLHKKPAESELLKDNDISISLMKAKASSTCSNFGGGGEYLRSEFDVINNKRNIVIDCLERKAPQILHPTQVEDRIFQHDFSNEMHVLSVTKANTIVGVNDNDGNASFLGSNFGLDIAKRTIGKWCKQDQTNKSSLKMQASTCHGNLIAVGADGKGGRVKVLRTQFEASKLQTPSLKRHKSGGSQDGQFQIEHFFGK